ncbi:stability determinant [Undibacterium sp. Di26W]|uniref:type II toxin-antitoxin system RelB family antitoxin n=1 Tax=Undibacterium sp. Di26W TaxID=3413035 RepID=UPI003BF24D6F
MTTELSPIVSEFATAEEAQAHDAWFRAKVQKSLDSTNPRRYSTDEVRQRMQEIIKAAEKNASSNLA